MDVFDLRNRLVGDYASYTRSFIKIADPRIHEKVDSELKWYAPPGVDLAAFDERGWL